MIPVLTWWFIMLVVGWTALPVTLHLFGWLPDRGYAFSKILGLLLACYLLWIGASTRLLRNDAGGIIFSILAVAALSAWIYFKMRTSDGRSYTQAIPEFLRRNYRLILVVETLFLLSFVAWSVLRAYAPEKIMNAGGEKFMEIAFLNGILNSAHFPPLDPWLSGFAISYYYFGYVMMAFLTRLSGVPAGVGFDLYDALLFALTMIGAFGIVFNLVASRLGRIKEPRTAPNQPLIYGLLGSLFVTLLGNLGGFFEALHAKGILPQAFWNWLDIPDLASAPVTGSWFPGTAGGWWWWRASRVLNDLDFNRQPISISPITEFPFFSFLLGDNHPHVLALPFVLLAIALAFNLFLRLRANFISRKESLPPPIAEHAEGAVSQPRVQPWWNPVSACLDGEWGFFLFSALILGSLGFLNTWDFPIYLGLYLLAYALGSYMSRNRLDPPLLQRVLVLGVGLFVTSIGLYIFFYLSFGSQAGGILPYVFPPTRLPQYLVMFGPFVFILAGFLWVYQLALHQNERRIQLILVILRAWVGVVVASLVVFVAVLLLAALSQVGRQFLQGGLEDPLLQSALGGLNVLGALRAVLRFRLEDPWLFLTLSGLIALILASINGIARRIKKGSPDEKLSPFSSEDLFALLLAFTGIILTLSVEFFYLRDSFGVRMNTVFKFYYQGWIMLACASAYGLWWLLNPGRQRMATAARYILQTAVFLLVLAGMVYPLMASYSRVYGFSFTPDLDGASGIARSNPDDWAAILWLQENASPANGVPVILEAPGGSYTYEGRISAFTGLPAVLGWAVHESQWRGNYVEQGKREPDIATIYTTHDGRIALELLQKWQVNYLVLGTPERQYIQKLCQDQSRSCSPATALRKFDLILTPVFQQNQTTIYQVPSNP